MKEKCKIDIKIIGKGRITVESYNGLYGHWTIEAQLVLEDAELSGTHMSDIPWKFKEKNKIDPPQVGATTPLGVDNTGDKELD